MMGLLTFDYLNKNVYEITNNFIHDRNNHDISQGLNANKIIEIIFL